MSTAVGESKIGKNFSKSMGRAKEKILQNLGKVDRTADEIFDEHVSNFNKQQFAATRLQKELNNYIRCIRACAAANKSLLEAVTDVYEPEWGDKDTLSVNSTQVEMLWNDFAHRLAEQVLIPLNTYQGQFPEMRKKVEKRGRKLVDFDGERHALQALQSNPRRAEAKLARQRESLEAAKRTYEVLNSELHEELPGLYGSRIVFLVSAMSTLFASENIFHSESAKIFQEFEGVVERLAKESAKGTLNFKSSNNAILNNRGDSMKDDNKGERSTPTPTTPTVKTTKQVVAELAGGHSYDNGNGNGNGSGPSSINTPPHRPPPLPASPVKKGFRSPFSSPSVAAPSPPPSLPSTPVPTTPTAETEPDKIKPTNNDEAGASGPGAKGPVPMANGDCVHDEKVESLNGDAVETPPMVPPKEKARMEADTTTTTSSDKKHEHLNGDGEGDGKGSVEKVADSVSESDDKRAVDVNNVVDMHTPPKTNGDAKINGNGRHSSGDSHGHPTRDHDHDDEPVKMDGHGRDSHSHSDMGKTPEKVSSSSMSATAAPGENAGAPAVVAAAPTSTTNNHSNSISAASPSAPPGETPKEEKGVLYRVRATYRYQKEDEDELSFEAGEIIRVIEYEDPEEQEEGWLMGVKDNGEKGMFPANFTRPI